MQSLLRRTTYSFGAVIASVPVVVFAQSGQGEHIVAAESLVGRINEVILFPLMTLMTAVALLVFLWGAFQYVYNAGDEAGRKTGRQHMIYGVLGLLVMVSAYTILQIAAGTFGVSA